MWKLVTQKGLTYQKSKPTFPTQSKIGYQFSITAITHCHKPNSLKEHKHYLKDLKVRSPKSVSTKSRQQQSSFLLELGRESFPCNFQLLQAVYIPWFMVSPQIIPTSFASIISYTNLTFLPAYKAPCGYIGPNRITQDNHPITKSAECLLPWYRTLTGFGGQDVDTFRDHLSCQLQTASDVRCSTHCQ